LHCFYSNLGWVYSNFACFIRGVNFYANLDRFHSRLLGLYSNSGRVYSNFAWLYSNLGPVYSHFAWFYSNLYFLFEIRSLLFAIECFLFEFRLVLFKLCLFYSREQLLCEDVPLRSQKKSRRLCAGIRWGVFSGGLIDSF
jgi:hypothetical protein